MQWEYIAMSYGLLRGGGIKYECKHCGDRAACDSVVTKIIKKLGSGTGDHSQKRMLIKTEIDK